MGLKQRLTIEDDDAFSTTKMFHDSIFLQYEFKGWSLGLPGSEETGDEEHMELVG